MPVPDRVVSHHFVFPPQARLASIADQWEFLTQKTTEKSLKLKEANKQRTYIAAVKDLDFWLGEVSCFFSNLRCFTKYMAVTFYSFLVFFLVCPVKLYLFCALAE